MAASSGGSPDGSRLRPGGGQARPARCAASIPLAAAPTTNRRSQQRGHHQHAVADAPASPIAPMIGSTMGRGSPTGRHREPDRPGPGRMANDSGASRPGRMARLPVITMFLAIARDVRRRDATGRPPPPTPPGTAGAGSRRAFTRRRWLPGADARPTSCWLCRSGHVAPLGLVETEHVVVEERGERHEPDERRQERQRVPDAAQRLIFQTSRQPRRSSAGPPRWRSPLRRTIARRSCAPHRRLQAPGQRRRTSSAR